MTTLFSQPGSAEKAIRKLDIAQVSMLLVELDPPGATITRAKWDGPPEKKRKNKNKPTSPSRDGPNSGPSHLSPQEGDRRRVGGGRKSLL